MPWGYMHRHGTQLYSMGGEATDGAGSIVRRATAHATTRRARAGRSAEGGGAAEAGELEVTRIFLVFAQIAISGGR